MSHVMLAHIAAILEETPSIGFLNAGNGVAVRTTELDIVYWSKYQVINMTALKRIHVVAAIIEDEGKVFATQRGYGPWKDWWEFPGGKLERGESPQQALVREIKEELDAQIRVGEYLMTVEYDYPEFHLSMDCFLCSVVSGQLTLLEHEAAKWLPAGDLRSVKWLPADLEIVALLEDRYERSCECSAIKLQVIRSSRKTMAIEIRPDLSVIVRVPMRTTDRQVRQFVAEKENWIRKHLEKMQMKVQEQADREVLTEKEVRELAEKALKVIPPKVAFYAEKLGVTYGRITIRNQRTRWGSCSAKGNLNFNCYLMQAPEEILDYVIVHELCHRLEMNHSSAFWEKVEKLLPDYKERRKWLKMHGSELMGRYNGGETWK